VLLDVHKNSNPTPASHHCFREIILQQTRLKSDIKGYDERSIIVDENHHWSSLIMHLTTKTASHHAFHIPWFDRAPTKAASPRIFACVQRNTGEPLTAQTDPGQFVIEFLTQLSKLHRSGDADEQDLRDRLGRLLDRTLDLKIIGDFLLASDKSTATWLERQNFNRHLRCYLIERIRAAIGSFSLRHLHVIDHYQDGVATVVVTELTFSVFSLHFQWILVDKPGGRRICNLIIEEIDLAAQLRKKLGAQAG
jgi:ABC-type transporter MlaC component